MAKDPDSFFCYLKLHSQTDLIVQSVLMGLSILLIGDAFRKYYRMRGSHNNHVTFVYRLLFFWWISTYSLSYSITIYVLHHNNPSQFITQTMSSLSKYYFFIDWVNAYTLQWALLYLPFQWYCQWDIGRNKYQFFLTLQLLINLAKLSLSSKQNIVDTRQEQIKFYIGICKLIYLVLPILFLAISYQAILSKFLILSLLVDCIFITYSLTFGMISLKTTEQLKEQLDEQQSKRTFNQYLVVIIANTIRFAIDLFFMIQNVFGEKIITEKCPVTQPNTDIQLVNEGENISNIIVTCLLTFYLPVFIILRIYNLEERPQKMCESLIISKTNEDTESYLTK